MLVDSRSQRNLCSFWHQPVWGTQHGLDQRLESSIALFGSQLLHTLDEFHDKFQCVELLLRIKGYQLLTVRHWYVTYTVIPYLYYVLYVLIFARVVWNRSTKSTKRHSKGAWKHKLMGYKNQVGGGLKPCLFSPLPTGKSSNLILTSIFVQMGGTPYPHVSSRRWCRGDLWGWRSFSRNSKPTMAWETRGDFWSGDRTTDTDVLCWKLSCFLGSLLIPFMKGSTYIGLEAIINSSFSDHDLIFPTRLSQILVWGKDMKVRGDEEELVWSLEFWVEMPIDSKAAARSLMWTWSIPPRRWLRCNGRTQIGTKIIHIL